MRIPFDDPNLYQEESDDDSLEDRRHEQEMQLAGAMARAAEEPGKIRERIRRYQRKLRADKTKAGMIHDGAGKRYLLGPP